MEFWNCIFVVAKRDIFFFIWGKNSLDGHQQHQGKRGNSLFVTPMRKTRILCSSIQDTLKGYVHSAVSKHPLIILIIYQILQFNFMIFFEKKCQHVFQWKVFNPFSYALSNNCSQTLTIHKCLAEK